MYGRFPALASLFVSIPLAAAGCSESAEVDPLTFVFDPSGIGRVEFTIGAKDLAILNADPEAENYVHGNFVYTSPDGAHSWSFNDVGVRNKGNTSLDTRLGKLPWKVKFNQWVEGQKFAGLKKLGFGTEYGDPTFVREALGYSMTRKAGIPAPRTQYVRIFLNGEDLGLYLLTEEIDDVFLKFNFGPDAGNAGNLYKISRGPLLYWGEDPDEYDGGNGSYIYQEGPESHPTFTDLIALARTLTLAPDDEIPDVLDPLFDVSGWLDVLALNTLQVNLDAATYSANNYYLLHDPEDSRFRVIPWDMDSSFAAFPPTATPAEKANLDIYNPKLTADPRPLVDRLLGNPFYRDEWRERLSAMRAAVFDPQALEQEVRDIWALIEPEMKTDPKLIYGYDAAATGLVQDVDSSDPVRRYPQPFPGLISFIHARAASVDQQLAAGPGEWPASEPFVAVDGAYQVMVTLPVAKGDLYLYVQGRSKENVMQTYLARPKLADQQVNFNTVFSVPASLKEATVIGFVDVAGDDWIDPGVDGFGMVTVPLPEGPEAAGRIDATVVVDQIWTGEALWASKFGAPTGL